MTVDDVAAIMARLTGVRRSVRGGFFEWRFHGRVVARQLDDRHLVIRSEFDARDTLLRGDPVTFSVPPRYVKHMMVVADLLSGDPDAIEDAIEAAWSLQRRND